MSKLKAIKVLNALIKENFNLEIFSIDNKPIVINKHSLREALLELEDIFKKGDCYEQVKRFNDEK